MHEAPGTTNNTTEVSCRDEGNDLFMKAQNGRQATALSVARNAAKVIKIKRMARKQQGKRGKGERETFRGTEEGKTQTVVCTR